MGLKTANRKPESKLDQDLTGTARQGDLVQGSRVQPLDTTPQEVCRNMFGLTVAWRRRMLNFLQRREDWC